MPNQNNNQNSREFNTPQKVVRTYSSDLAKSVQEKGGEAYRIARVEQGIKEREAKIIAKRNKMNLLFGLGGLGLIATGIIAFIYFSSITKVILNPEPPAAGKSIFYFDSQNKINVEGMDYGKILIAYRKTMAETKKPSGQIEAIDFTENNQKISLSRFFNLLQINPPKETEGFWDKNYFVGLFSDSGENWPFIILRTNSYRDISPKIIPWENLMLDDLSAWLDIDVTGENSYLLQSKFSDNIISNKETRVIKDKSGEIAILYAYLDENNILFARNKKTLDEVLLRLYSSIK